MRNLRCWFGRHAWFRLPPRTDGGSFVFTSECSRCGLKRASVLR